MRPLGGAGSARSPGLRGHAWCLHGDVAEYRRGLAGFFAEGLQDGLRVAYVGSDGAEAAGADLADLSDLDRLLAVGALHVLSARDVYGAGGPVDPERVVARVAAATEQALADGFGGLAMSADATELVRTPAKRDAFARYEFLVDRYMASHPLSALCGYGLELGNDTVTEFALLHAPEPVERGAVPGVRLRRRGDRPRRRVRPGRRRGARTACYPAFGQSGGGTSRRRHGRRRVRRPSVAADARPYARGNGIAVSLRSAPPFAARLMELLPVSSLQLAKSGAQG